MSKRNEKSISYICAQLRDHSPEQFPTKWAEELAKRNVSFNVFADTYSKSPEVTKTIMLYNLPESFTLANVLVLIGHHGWPAVDDNFVCQTTTGVLHQMAARGVPLAKLVECFVSTDDPFLIKGLGEDLPYLYSFPRDTGLCRILRDAALHPRTPSGVYGLYQMYHIIRWYMSAGGRVSKPIKAVLDLVEERYAGKRICADAPYRELRTYHMDAGEALRQLFVVGCVGHLDP